jgi:FemAB-related protein (PEP-CTERM system-associated)
MASVIRELDRQREPAWDEFVFRDRNGTFFHRSGWKHVIESAFGHRTYYLLAERDGALTGVLPLVHLKSILFGNRLVSVPFGVYGGPLAAERESAALLVDHSIGLANRLGVDSIEFRARAPVAPAWTVRSDLYATFRKPISENAEANLKAVPRKQRAVIRKSLENGLRSTIDDDPARFYQIYSASVRSLGTPVFSPKYVRELKRVFKDDLEIATILDNDDVVLSSVLSFFFRDEVLPYYGGGSLRARQRGAYDFMYWKVMSRGVERGARLFDFGRSKFGTGSFSFKKNWGFDAEPLTYQYWVRSGHRVPDLNPLNPKYHLMINAWKRLPLPLANLLGPPLARRIG